MLDCPSCGKVNPDEARFCNSCGAPLAVAAAGVRKVVSVLFCDLVGSTALGDGADPEVLRAQMSRYHSLVRSVLERHGGTVEKFIGDAAMAVFGLPSTHEDDSLRAARAALEIQRAVADLTFEVRIGVNTGEVVAGEGETFVTGDAVNLAARLEQSAATGEILIGALTERLIRDAVVTERVEPLRVKGKGAPVTAYRLVALRERIADADADSASETPFVGRSAEIEVLRRALALATLHRQPQLATIVGPPGIGKSRLVRELLGDGHARVYYGRCLSYGEGITYWPLQEIARQIGDIRAALASDAEAELAASRLDAALGQGAATPDEIAWGFRRLLEALGRAQPLVVVIEDIHWAEPQLLDLIEYLAEFSHDASLFLLCTARAELLERRPDWSTPRDHTTLLTLEPLGAEQVEALVNELGELPAAERNRIIAAADGNPLFIEQMVAMRAEAGDADAELEVPPTIQALLAARIDRLDPAERVVIERGSVEGRLFHRGAVQELLPETARPDVGRRLLALVRHQFIRPDRAQLPGDDGFRFDHVLIRDAAYESLPKKIRADLHERFADWLAGRLASDAPTEILGYHLEQAYRYRQELGDVDATLGERAAEKLLSAADAASTRRDTHAEIVLLERALLLLEEHSPHRPRALANLGEALYMAGDAQRGSDTLRAAERLARETGDKRVEWVARLRTSLIQAEIEPEGAADRMLRESAAALSALPDDPEVAARAWLLQGSANNFRGLMGEQYRAAQIAWEQARVLGDARLEIEILAESGGPLAFGPVPVDEGLRWLASVEQIAFNRPATEFWSRHILAHLHARLGDFDAARSSVESWRAQLRDLGRHVAYVRTAACAWDVCSLASDWSGGERVLREAYDELGNMGDVVFRPLAAAHLAEALFRQGKLGEVDELLAVGERDSATDDPLNQAGWRRVKAEVLAARGEVDKAIPLAREAVEILSNTDLLDEHAGALLALARVMRAGRMPAEASASVHEAIALYERKGNLVGRAKAERMLMEIGAQAGT